MTRLAGDVAKYVQGGRTASVLEQKGQFGRTFDIAGKEGGLICMCGHGQLAHRDSFWGCYYEDCDCEEFFEPRVNVLGENK